MNNCETVTKECESRVAKNISIVGGGNGITPIGTVILTNHIMEGVNR
jgi:hypothetical protein